MLDSFNGVTGPGWGKQFRMEECPVEPTMFAMLCCSGWIHHVWFPKGVFRVSKIFIDRLQEKNPTNPPMANPPPMRIENGLLIVQNPDGCTGMHLTYDGLTEMIRERMDLKQKVDDQEYEINRRQPDRFLPEVIRKLDECFAAAQKTNDTARGEAYAASAAMIRGFLRESDEREKKR